MDVRRGKLPETVTRPLEIDLSRDELVAIVTNYLKAKLKASEIKIEFIKGIGSVEDGSAGTVAKLEAMTLTGLEVVPIPWPAPAAPEPKQ